MPDTQPKVYNTAARDHGTSSKMGEEEGGGGEGLGWTGHPEFFTGLPFSMRKTIKGLWGCSKFFAELIKLWFKESLHQTKYFIVYVVTAAQILLTKFTDACCVILS